MTIQEPVRTTSYPAGYPYTEQFDEVEYYRGFEGGAWYTGESNGRFVVISDEGTFAGLLDEPIDWVCIHEFTSRSARDAWLAHHSSDSPDC